MTEIQNIINERFLLQEEYMGAEKLVNKILPLVSVTVATYQHVNYIKECLDGILMQKVNFAYEIILGEDGSIDGTQEICKEYAEKYPDKIRLFIRDRELSQYFNSKGEFIMRFNGVWNRMSVRGKYIAWCEGDDYWTDPLKLQKQVDFLEANPEYGMVYTNSKIYDNIKKRFCGLLINRHTPKDLSLKNLILGYHLIPTNSVLFLQSLIPQYLIDVCPQDKNWLFGDTPLWIWMIKNSKVKYIDIVTGVYRILTESASHSKNPQKMENLCRNHFAFREWIMNKYEIKDEKLKQRVKYIKIRSLMGLACTNNYEVKRIFEEVKYEISQIKIFSLQCLLLKIIIKFPILRHFGRMYNVSRNILSNIL